MSKRRRRKPNRSPESYVSKDPAKRQAQLGNLRTTPSPFVGRPPEHGGYAKLARETIEAKAVEVYDALEADVPVAGSWAVPVRLLAETLLRLDSVSDYLRRRGWEAEDGSVRPAARLEHELQARALTLAKELGLTPLAASRLGVNVAHIAQFDLAREWADVEGEASDG